MEQLAGMTGSFGGFLANPMVIGFLVIFGLAGVFVYSNYMRMKNNPYFIDSLQKKFMLNAVKKRYKIVTVNYIRIGHNNNIIISAIRRELLGKKGLYMEYLDELINVPSEYLITGAGDDDVLYYVVTDSNIGYPIKLTLVKENEDAESLVVNKSALVGLLASKKKHDLFISQHFKALTNGLKTRIGRGKTQLDRLLESGVPAIFIVGGLLAFILMYNFAVTSQTELANNVGEYRDQSFKLQEAFMERDRYCQVFISRYGTQTELDKYLSYPSGFEKLNTGE